MFSIVKLASETLTENYNPSIFNYFYETFPDGIWVAEKLNKIIGFIIGVKTGEEKGRILMLSVEEKNRRQNIGTTLLKNLLSELVKHNVKYIELEVRTDNKKAIQFYQKHGFRIVDTIKNFYQNGENAYLMTKII
jgi:ribosomal-protein-alanine N-acetyltransferase